MRDETVEIWLTRLILIASSIMAPGLLAIDWLRAKRDKIITDPLRADFESEPKSPIGSSLPVSGWARIDLLDDPRMNGETWVDVADVTQEMIDAWPIWERLSASDPKAHIFLFLSTPRLKNEWYFVGCWRPLRFPGQDLVTGVVPAIDMIEEYRDRCEWDIRIKGVWVSSIGYRINKNYPQRWRPTGWPELP